MGKGAKEKRAAAYRLRKEAQTRQLEATEPRGAERQNLRLRSRGREAVPAGRRKRARRNAPPADPAAETIPAWSRPLEFHSSYEDEISDEEAAALPRDADYFLERERVRKLESEPAEAVSREALAAPAFPAD